MYLDADNPTVDGIRQTLGPYMRDHFRRDIRFQDELEVLVSPVQNQLEIAVGPVGDNPEQYLRSQRVSPSVKIFVRVGGPLVPEMKELGLDLMAFVPQERVVAFKTHYLEASEEVLAAMPNIEVLWQLCVPLSNGFLQPRSDGLHVDRKLLPSLRFLCLHFLRLEKTGWEPLKRCLTHNTSDSRAVRLSLSAPASCHMSWEVVKEIRGLVETFTYLVEGYGHRNVNGSEEDYEHFGRGN
jgi:hypothetical protein